MLSSPTPGRHDPIETLAQLGITDQSDRQQSEDRFADGSSIQGETTYTKTDGTTGIVADAAFARDPNGYAVTTTTQRRRLDHDHNKACSDGSPANDTIATTSDAQSVAVSKDSNGDGVIDSIETRSRF